MIFAAVFFWFVLAYYREIVDADELSFTMLTVQLKLIYWIGPVGALQFLLTAIVLFDPVLARTAAGGRRQARSPARTEAARERTARSRPQAAASTGGA